MKKRTVLKVSAIIGVIIVLVLFYFLNSTAETSKGMQIIEISEIEIEDEISAQQTIKSSAKKFGLHNGFDELVTKGICNLESSGVYRVQQYYHGVPVYGRYASLVVSKTTKEAIIATDIRDIPKDISTTPIVSSDEISESLKQYIIDNYDSDFNDELTITDENLVIYDFYDYMEPVLAYCISANDNEYLFDASTGDILCIREMSIQDRSIAQNEAGTIQVPINKVDDQTFDYPVELDDGRVLFIYDFQGKNSSKTGYKREYILKLEGNNIFGDTGKEKRHRYDQIPEFYRRVEEVRDYFIKTYNQDTPGNNLILGVNDRYCFGDNLCAWYIDYLDGYSSIKLGKSRDVKEDTMSIAHEYTHTIQLFYDVAREDCSEAGIMEGLADVFAMFESGYRTGTITWSLDDGYRDATQSHTIDEKLTRKEPHTNAECISRTAYLMSNSGQFTFDELQKLWFNTMLILPTSCTYEQFRNCMIQMAEFLFKNTGKTDAIKSALDDVGITSDVKTKLNNSFTTTIHSKSGSIIRDYQLHIEGYSKKILGFGSSKISENFTSDPSTGKCDVSVPKGDYTIRITDTISRRQIYSTNISTVKNGTISELSCRSDLSVEAILVPGSSYQILDSNGETFDPSTISVTAINIATQEKTALEGNLDVPEGRYRLCFEYANPHSTKEQNNATETYIIIVEIFNDGFSEATFQIDIEPTAHEWVEASCIAPRTCSICNVTEGEKLPHSWVEATCSVPKTCSVCNTTEGESLPHTWLEATWDEPRRCSVCGKTDGVSQKTGVYNQYAEVLQSLEQNYGVLQITTEKFGEYLEKKYYTGLCYAELLDMDGNGIKELITVVGNGINDYTLAVYGYNGTGLARSGIHDGYIGDGFFKGDGGMRWFSLKMKDNHYYIESGGSDSFYTAYMYTADQNGLLVLGRLFDMHEGPSPSYTIDDTPTSADDWKSQFNQYSTYRHFGLNVDVDSESKDLLAAIISQTKAELGI